MSNLFRGCSRNVIFVTVNVLGINQVNWGELPSVLCCARILVCYFGFECKINLLGGCLSGPVLSLVCLGGAPCQVDTRFCEIDRV